jgi:hypothetical protein
MHPACVWQQRGLVILVPQKALLYSVFIQKLQSASRRLYLDPGNNMGAQFRYGGAGGGGESVAMPVDIFTAVH